MKRIDTHQIALRAIHHLLGGAKPFEVDAGTTKVTCSMTAVPAASWPAGITGVVEAEDGPWPRSVAVDCRWTEGACRLVVEPFRWTSGAYGGDLCVRVRTDQNREVIFVNVSKDLKGAEDGSSVKLDVRFYVISRKTPVSAVIAAKLNQGMRDVLAASRIPLVGKNTAELCELEVPAGTLVPSAELVFRRLVQLALLKLDFIDRGRTAERGTPIIELGRWLPQDQLGLLVPDDDEPDSSDEPTAAGQSAAPEDASSEANDAAASDLPLNLILYGPPGTGKTYELTNTWIKRFQRAPTTTDAVHDIVEDLTWTNVIAIALHERGGKAKVADLEQHSLVKAKYATGPMKAPLRKMLWGVLQTHTVETSKTVGYKLRVGELMFDKKDGSTWVLAVDLPEELRDVVKQRKAPGSTSTLDDFIIVTFHQAYGYEDFIEGIRPKVEVSADDEGGLLSYALEDGAFLKAARAALRLAGYEGSLHDFCSLAPGERKERFAGARPYAVFIDEINRGNVARIFGELITLLEDDKRLGAAHEVIVQLPYSKKKFGVPPNLHVIGTMNTADRSIEALDTALRRRFEFQEMPPRLDLLDFDIDGGIRPDRMLHAINRRLEKLYDRDHCIGHAYLQGLRDKPTLEGLKRVFRNKLIPLLQEYFYGDWGKIGLVLGKDFVRKREAPGKLFAEFDHDDHDALAERSTWELLDLDKLSNVAFRRIYEDVADA